MVQLQKLLRMLIQFYLEAKCTQGIVYQNHMLYRMCIGDKI